MPDYGIKQILQRRAGVGIGRRSGLKIRRLLAYGFESRPAHQPLMSLKVFNLCCDHGHRFEGWFASAADYDSQSDRGQIECPVCESRGITKTPSAPRLNFGATATDTTTAVPTNAPAPSAMIANEPQLQALVLALARQIAANTEDVGERFVDEVRAIHYDEAPKRSIRGVASRQDAIELADEGIDVMPLPFADLLDEPVQ